MENRKDCSQGERRRNSAVDIVAVDSAVAAAVVDTMLQVFVVVEGGGVVDVGH